MEGLGGAASVIALLQLSGTAIKLVMNTEGSMAERNIPSDEIRACNTFLIDAKIERAIPNRVSSVNPSLRVSNSLTVLYLWTRLY